MVAASPAFRSGVALRNVGARNHGRRVHHGQQRRAGSGRFAGIDGTVGDHAVDGAANLRVGKLRGGALVLSLGRSKLALGRLQLLLLAGGLQRGKMLFGDFVLRLRLDQRHCRLISSLRGSAPCSKSVLAAVVNFLLRRRRLASRSSGRTPPSATPPARLKTLRCRRSPAPVRSAPLFSTSAAARSRFSSTASNCPRCTRLPRFT